MWDIPHSDAADRASFSLHSSQDLGREAMEMVEVQSVVQLEAALCPTFVPTLNPAQPWQTLKTLKRNMEYRKTGPSSPCGVAVTSTK